ncbi:hypothetical protein N7537_009572 [Penicillium hordei]|uniref:Uncharacterized protein n=1 Tax=Penicillium hordei TaxID=40994 RepID=A0AAD6DSY6_9EURO|nr:uncharacterized protein N7537_009572 [Penicillium hordei]KAJ5592668.1 hypothetical protein N7537_009572 [Penicillium hordei]
MDDLPLILNLVEVTGPLQFNFPSEVFSTAPHYVNLKHNLRLLLSQDEESIEATKIAKAIIRESEKELREALASGNSPNDMIGVLSALELAFGWPKGIQILLQSGANPHCHFPSLALAEGEQYHASAALLLEAGCVIKVVDFVNNEQCNDGGKRRSLLVDHLAARRRRLCMLAESSLPLDQIPPLDGPPANICGALAAHGINVPIALHFEADSLGSTAIYKTGLASRSRHFAKVMNIMYEIGFHDIDLPDENGITPLMTLFNLYPGDAPVFIDCVAWLMSRGACIERKLPTSNAKVAHLLTAQFINRHIYHLILNSDGLDKDYRNWKNGVAELGDACFFVSPTQDCCVCACSPGGCTTLSVALRSIIFTAYLWRWRVTDDCLRKLILSLTVWQDSWPDFSRAVVRTLTFDALGLTHTCCTEIDEDGVFWPSVPKEGRDEIEVGRISDDQYFLVREFEELMEEMESKLDELGLPLEEFLDGYWYDRVIEHLSRRDRYDEEHVTEARKMGIFLEAEEFCIPNRLSLQFRSQVQELQDDSLLDGPK